MRPGSFSGAQSQDTRQMSRTETWEVPPKHSETSSLLCDCALTEAVQRGFTVSLLTDHQKPSTHAAGHLSFLHR